MRPVKMWAPPTAHWVLISLCALVFLNVIDALATIEIIGRGGEEGNPIVRPLFEIGSSFFFFCKLSLILPLAIMLAWYARSCRFAWWMLCLANSVYIAIAGLHAYLLLIVAHPH